MSSSPDFQSGQPVKALPAVNKQDIHGHRVDIAVGTCRIVNGQVRGLGRVENKNVAYGKLIQRMSTPVVDTSISLAQYLAADQDRKSLAKAAPGNWTAGRYKGSSRRISELVGRSCIVYDLDHASSRQIKFIRDGSAEIKCLTPGRGTCTQPARTCRSTPEHA
jgi:hypothetical protein